MPPRLHEDELLVARDGAQGVGHHDGDVARVLPLVPEAGGASYSGRARHDMDMDMGGTGPTLLGPVPGQVRHLRRSTRVGWILFQRLSRLLNRWREEMSKVWPGMHRACEADSIWIVV